MADKPAFPRNEELTAISIAFKNPDINLIADEVLPRTSVGTTTFHYTEYPKHQAFTVPNTRVGERSRVPTIELKGEKKTTDVEGFAIGIPLTANDIAEAAPGVDPRGYATEQATNLIMLDREARVAAMVSDPANYAAANKSDLSADLGPPFAGAGAQQFDEADASPLVLIKTKIDACLMRPNVVAFGMPAWNAFSAHPKVVSAALGNDGVNGFATRERVAELLEVDAVIVGRGWVNSVKPGKTPVFLSCWQDVVLAFYRDRTVTPAGGVTFGLTAQLGTRQSGSKVIDIGVDGGTEVRAWEKLRELIVASSAAHLFYNCMP